jgi:hypothetical protein
MIFNGDTDKKKKCQRSIRSQTFSGYHFKGRLTQKRINILENASGLQYEPLLYLKIF